MYILPIAQSSCTLLLLLLLLLLACGPHNHTYIKPRNVQLKIPASSMDLIRNINDV